MKKQAWKDPIIEEVRKVRKELDKEFQKDPEDFMDRARRSVVKAGFKLVPPTPSSRHKKAG